ncbi:dicarboxylate/amino acid:cation symporter [Roseiconus lacunae]|uniref:dicarboxylate/amino acid:cation symporter n=1 Tax=Roseiconus lacunae TaxID=2605694 RepID=UPI001E520CF6|nr:dicarboxylate/amino acid:cation symporter [Roseiconus lacunae]MCD0459279.1 dicarboxylate/amino acid:cation symporter [Roseiconus lacunae]
MADSEAWYKKSHWQIIIGMLLGLVYGLIAAAAGWSKFTNDWVAPFGVIFINSLQLIAIPLVVASLVLGVASLSDLKKLSRIGGKTMGIYIGTTAIAVVIGLVIVNVLQPGLQVPEAARTQLQEQFAGDVSAKEEIAADVQTRGPLQILIDIVPSNFFSAASSNRNMLQIVFVSLMVGIGLIQLEKAQAKPMIDVLESLNHVVIRLVDLIMLFAPIGVFSLIARTITDLAGDDFSQILQLLTALGFYCISVVLGLTLHVCITYFGLLKLVTKMPIKTFLQGIAPVQLVAFSTSSSGATLPLTMERCEEKLGVSEEVSSFVIPLGATINMDGTALYQAVAAVFIAQSMGMDVGLTGQLTIVLTAVLASIGTAAVPGAGIIMLVIILQSIGVPSSGIALILGVDRILDMLRTVTNVTGDASVAVSIASMEGQLNPPNLSEVTDHIRTHGEENLVEHSSPEAETNKETESSGD